MSKAADAIISKIKKNESTVFVTQVELDNLKSIDGCITKISICVPNVIVMILASSQDEKTLYAALHVRDGGVNEILTASIQPALVSGSVLQAFAPINLSDRIRIVEIKYPELSEHSALKLIDIVSSYTLATLSRMGLYKVESDNEVELTFDDL